MNDRSKRSKGISIVSPVMAILQDHLLVPSRTICSACSRLSMCVSGSTENVVLKRRQFPRHRIVLRQPLLRTPPPHPIVIALCRREKRGPLSRRGLQEVYVLRRPPKDTGSSRGLAGDIVRNQSNVIQQQRRFRVFSSPAT